MRLTICILAMLFMVACGGGSPTTPTPSSDPFGTWAITVGGELVAEWVITSDYLLYTSPDPDVKPMDITINGSSFTAEKTTIGSNVRSEFLFTGTFTDDMMSGTVTKTTFPDVGDPVVDSDDFTGVKLEGDGSGV